MVTFNLDRRHFLDICVIEQEIKDIYVYGSLLHPAAVMLSYILKRRHFFILVNCKVTTITNTSVKIEIASSMN